MQSKKNTRARLGSALAVVAASLAIGIGGVLPLSAGFAHAADDYSLWEDCDWDGYDDHTGAKVPWPGFDGTKGDTPSGPSETSQTGKKQAAAEDAAAEKAAAEKAAAEKAAAEKA
ncbi:MAG TPA: hypothetical protein PLQ63_13170, partial [Propionicimonas sp.]|nr:hypothetical protein [Propionicimonas sp.]